MARGVVLSFLMGTLCCCNGAQIPTSDGGASQDVAADRHGNDASDGADGSRADALDDGVPATDSGDSSVPPVDVRTPDAENPDVTPPDVSPMDAIDVWRAPDGSPPDRCGQGFYRAAESLPAVMAADGAADVDASGDAMDARDVAADVDRDTVCRALQDEFNEFAFQNNACSVDADCMLVRGTEECECGRVTRRPHGIASSHGAAVSTTVTTQVEAYVDRWTKVGCEFWYGRCESDSTPPKGVQCLAARCSVIQNPPCNQPPPPRPEPPPPLPEPCW